MDNINDLMDDNLEKENDKIWNRGRVEALIERYYRENGWQEKENIPYEEMIILFEYVIGELNL